MGCASVLATYVWDPLSRRASLAYGNGTTQSYSYSKAGDLETHTHTITGNSNTWTNSYTKAHQLLSEAASNAAWVFQPAVNETTSYGSANNLNQYVTVTHAANPMATLYYDGNGNLIDDGAWDFEYDAENRLTKASNVTTGTTAQYLYDPMGRRQAKIVGSVTTSFLSDGAEEIAEYDGAGGLLRRYIPGPGTDQPIAMVTPSGGSHLHSYFHTNRQGSTVAMSNDAGTVSEGPYTYDAYGQGAPSTGVPFKYTGRRLDPETGLYYYRARYYSAALGRFLQTDPVGYADQMNLYGYVGNDPINGIDPTGEKAYLVSRTIGPGYNHMFVIVVDDETGEIRRFSYASQGGFFNRGQLVSITNSGTDVDIFDGEAAEDFLENPDAATERGISAVPIDASDEAVIVSGEAMDRRLGTAGDPGPVPYWTIPEQDFLMEAANSNSAAYGVANDAVKSKDPKRVQKLPPGTRNPGWGSHRNIPRGTTQPVAKGPVASSCRGTRIRNAKTGSIC